MIPVQCVVDTSAAMRLHHAFRPRLWLVLLLIIAIFGPLLASTPATAGVNQWTSIGPYGGSIIALAASASSPVVYAATAQDIFYSGDGGTTWERRSDGLEGQQLFAVLVDPTNAATAYAGASDGLFKSTNSGASWTKLEQGLGFGGFDALTLAPSAPSTLYAAMSFGTYKTTNGGTSWNQVSSGISGTTLGLTVDPGNPDVLYAGTYEGMYKSSNGGVSWARSDTGMPENTRVYKVAVDPTNSQILYAATVSDAGVYRSTDGGANWMPADLNVAGIWVLMVAIEPQSPSTIYAGTTSGLYRSTNSAGSWSKINSVPNLNIEALASGFGSSRYVGTGGSGVYRSVDGGTSWSSANTGLRASNMHLIALHPTESNLLYAGTYGGTLTRSTDGGSTWAPAMNGLVDSDGRAADSFSALVIDPLTPTTLYLGSRMGPFKSTDGGASWSWIDPASSGCFVCFLVWVNDLVIDPQNPANLYMGSSAMFTAGVYRSTTAGASWSSKNQGLANTEVLALALDPQTPSTLYAGTQDGIYKSTNSADSWAPASNGLGSGTQVSILAVAPSSPSTIYASNGSGLFRSTDGAANWGSVTQPTGTSTGITAIVIDPASAATIYLGRFDGVYRTTNAGASWERIGDGWPDRSVTALALSPANTSLLYAGASSAGIYTHQIVAKPQITTQPAGQTVAKGSQATLSVAATDATSLTYQWYRGASGDTSNPVAGATDATLTTPALEANTSFWVRITNTPGASSDSAAAMVTVVTSLELSVAAATQADTPLNITVRARDAAGILAPGYRGTVRLSSSDTQATLSPDYTFAPSDSGTHSFTVTLRSLGEQTVTVADNAAASVNGSAKIRVSIEPPMLTVFLPAVIR